MSVQLYPEAPRPRASRIIRDLVIIAMLGFLAWVGHEVYQRVDSVGVVASGVTSAGTSVQGGFDRAADAVDSLPVVGKKLAKALGSSGDATGGNVADMGRTGEKAINDVARLAGLATFLIPSLLLLGLTLPGRIRGIRQMGEAREFLGDGGDPERQRLLAMRAAFGLPVDVLLEYTPDPIGDLGRGDHGPLLDALYAESGLVRRSGPLNDPANSH